MNQPVPTSPRHSWVRSALFRIACVSGLVAAVFTLSSCSTVKVKIDQELVTKTGIESANLLGKVAGAPSSDLSTFAESNAKLLKQARNLEGLGLKKEAAAAYLKAAAETHVLLASRSVARGSQAEKALAGMHNSAIACFARLWVHDPRSHDPGPCVLSWGAEKLEIELSKSSTYKSGYFDQLIAAAAVVEESAVPALRTGYGAPFVAIREQRPEREEEMRFFPPRGMHTPVTVTLDSVTKAGGVTRVSFSTRNPMIEQTVSVGLRRLPLAAHYSAPVAVILKGRIAKMEGLRGYFAAKKRIEESGIYLSEPYDPKRIPVILIHGLISVPMIWRDVVPEMIADPELSQRYQFMAFTYPSSFPVVESAALLRDELAALRARYDPDSNDPLSTDLVVVGHSMGGMLARTLATDFGDNIWKQFSDTPLDRIPMAEAQKANICRLVEFDPDPAVRRVVYYSTPHRGVTMAEKGIANAVSKLARMPANVIKQENQIFDPILREHLKIPLDGTYTSAQSLTPGSPMVSAMEVSPYKSGVTYHSVMGDQGKGDTPNSSDGVVEYWSSHQDGAASEVIVPTGHGSYKHPRAIAELKRILYLHAGI